MGEHDFRDEWLKCFHSEAYFIHNYCIIYDATAAKWIPFRLWKDQYTTVKAFETERLVVILKARQLGLTWLCLGHILWKIIFHPAQTVLLFSRREDEAIYLLQKRLKGMYAKLPEWMKAEKFVTDSRHEWHLDNGSIVYAFPTTAGDSYTASLVLVDEADLVPDLSSLMNAVKPTIDGGGSMILLSRSNKDEPNSPFKKYYRAAKSGENEWKSIFLPWYSRPDRDEVWYEKQKVDILTRTGAVDDLWQQYPATDAEALAPRTMAKRIPPAWLERCLAEEKGLKSFAGSPAISGLVMYRKPISGVGYLIGADPAEGNPTSDDSSLVVLDEVSGEEVATLTGKLQPDTFAGYIAEISAYYNRAGVMIERNNHGHTVISWLKGNAPSVHLLRGDDNQTGWQTTGKSKALMYTTASECFRDMLTTIHTFETYMQLTSIEGTSLKAPKGESDDRATSFALALQALHMPKHIDGVWSYA